MIMVLRTLRELSINNSLIDFTNFRASNNRAITLLNNIDSIGLTSINTTISLLGILTGVVDY